MNWLQIFLARRIWLWDNGCLVDGCVPYEYVYQHKLSNLCVDAKNREILKQKIKVIEKTK